MLTINLTSTYQRLSICRIALTSLLMQSRVPDQINLWVSREPYLRDDGIADIEAIDELVDSLPDFSKGLIKIRWVRNSGPYRKLIPILREAGPNDVFVTADDDIFYGRNWLSKLLSAYEDQGNKPVAARVRKKSLNFVGKRTSYIYWKIIDEPTMVDGDFVVTFGGGAVLTRSMFREEDIVDDSFLELAATADDLWYSKLLELKGSSVFVVPSALNELNFIQHNDGLINHNFPLASSLFNKIKLKIWDNLVGLLGFPVCGNDLASMNIEKYFNARNVK